MSHPGVLEAAVIGSQDRDGLIKPLACVVFEKPCRSLHRHGRAVETARQGAAGSSKYPRRVEFLDELPKTATGKIQRFRLRELFGQPLA